MERALIWSTDEVDVQVYTTQFEEDREIIPTHFIQLSNLKRSVLDVNPQLKERKLPLIGDILEKATEIEAYDYLIYTNADIALMPHFYSFVASQLLKGHDALVINRRRIGNHYQFPEDLDLMYADLGRSHPGFDCFVFKKELINQFILDNICIGIPFLEVSLIHNIASFAKHPLYVMNGHLTFHLGTEVLSSRQKNPFYWHNRNSYFRNIQPKLSRHFKLSGFPYFSERLTKRSLKWMLNPSLFTRNYIQLEGKNLIEKLRSFRNEWRWRLLQR